MNMPLSEKLASNTASDQINNMTSSNEDIHSGFSVSLKGEAPNFKLKEHQVKEKNLNSLTKKKHKVEHPKLKKIDNLILQELKDDYLKISILLDKNKNFDEQKLTSSTLKDTSTANDELQNKQQPFKTNKKRSWIARKLFGKTKEEKEFIEKQQEIQREELRKKLNSVFAKDKIEKEKSSEIHNTLDINSNKLLQAPCIDNSFSFNDVFLSSEEALSAYLNSKKKHIIFAFKNDIKKLEEKYGDYSLVIGKNILPDKLKKSKSKIEAKEELSEIDKLYLSAFSDISIPDEDIDLEDDEFFVNDPLEIEELFDLADESLTADMESAILSQLKNLEQNDCKENDCSANSIQDETTQQDFFLNKNKNLKITNKIDTGNIDKTNKNYAYTSENFAVRFTSFTIDFIFILSVSMLVSIYLGANELNNISGTSADSNHIINFFFIFLKTFVSSFFAYFIISYTFFQKTFGLSILSYKVKSLDGTKPKFTQIAVRILCMPISLFSMRGYFGNQSLHGKLSKTKLVKEY